jgi:acetyl-CoA carboxylase alpha subunit
MAQAQRVRATDLHALGTVEVVVAEPADDDPADLARAVGAEVRHQLERQLSQLSR